MPEWLIALFENGVIVGFAVLMLIVETAALLWMRRGGRALIFNALSGIALLLALGGALAEPHNYIWIAACLTAGFVAHLGDLWVRCRR